MPILSIKSEVKSDHIILTRESHERAAGPLKGTEVFLNSWVQFKTHVLDRPIVVQDEWLDKTRTDKRKIKSGKLQGYSLARYKNRHRLGENLIENYAMGFDIDNASLNPNDLRKVLQKIGYTCLWHTTLSHTDAHPRYRLIFPLDEPCETSEGDRWLSTWQHVCEHLSQYGLICDPAPKNRDRFWYWPACMDLKDYHCDIFEGQMLSVFAVQEPIPVSQPVSSSQCLAPRSSHYDLEWVHRQCAEYKTLQPGTRDDWIGRKCLMLGGLFGSGAMSPSVTRDDIIDTVHNYVMLNSHSSRQSEYNKVRRAFDAGAKRPLEPKKKKSAPAREKMNIAPIEESKPKLICKDGGIVKNMQVNVDIILDSDQKLQDILKYDAYTRTVMLVKALPGSQISPLIDQYPRELRDSDYSILQAYIETTYNFSPRESFCVQSVRKKSQKHAFHPIKEYLDNLRSQTNEDLLSTWMIKWFGIKDSDYVRAVSKRFLISAVARVYDPGCKVDTMLILEGEQGVYKSTALNVLFGKWFTDNLSDIHNKDVCLDMQGKWGIEVAELHKLRSADIEALKAFVSRQVDRFRPPYGREVVQAPRQCVLVGTTNQYQYLRDESGGRRFWPVLCGNIDIEQLRESRDELWAQAVDAYKKGDKWWLETKELQALAAEVQADRQEIDPWFEKIYHFLLNKDVTSVMEIMGTCLGGDIWKINRADSNRITACMRMSGWVRFKSDKNYKWRRERESDRK